MRKFILLFLLVTGIAVFAQHGKGLKNDKLISNDSMVNAIKENQQAVADSLDSLPLVEQPVVDHSFNSNLDELVAMQNKNVEKQKRNAYIRIGIGVAGLIVLVIGLSRRRKKTSV
jgi:hypothetical protein